MSGNATLPLVSIVIPHRNRAELLAETLRSVEAQEYPNWEVVVVDDGSEDRSVEIMRSFPCKLVRFPARRGVARAARYR